MDETVFTKIIKGEIPCHKIYEDEKTFAFLDIHPIQPGMVLVVSKNPIDHFMDLPDEDYVALFNAVKLISQKIRSVYPHKRVGVAIEGFELPHAHVKLFPIGSGPEFRAVPPTAEPDHNNLTDIAKQLKIQ